MSCWPLLLLLLLLLLLGQIGGNMFHVEPQQQFLKTWENTQQWLKLNLETYAHAESEQTLVAPLRGRAKAK